MGRPGVAVAAAVLLALAACGNSQEREKQAQELAAAEKKLAEAKAFGEDMAREKQLITTQLADAQARLDELRAAYHGTLAGAAYLAAEEGNGLAMTWEMNAAREGFQLAEAARQKNKKAVEGLAERVLADERPCVANEDEEGEGEGGCGPCDVAPYEDACTGVEKNTTSSPDWSCASLTATGEGLPPAAFCTSAIEHPAPGTGADSPYAEQNLPTELQVVRVAFVHQGRLYVSDYPKPDPSLYNPPNVEPLVACTATTTRNSCIHDCEVQFNRYEDPCACREYFEPEHDDSEETEDDESDEPAEVRQARQAAAEAEAEAQAARERAEEAQQEVSYQQCLASCEPSDEEETAEADPEAPPDPVSTTVTASLEAAPAPGIFVVSRRVRALGPAQQVLKEEKSTVVLRHPALVTVWKKLAPPPSELLGSLEPVGELEEVVSEGEKPSLKPLPGKSEPTLVGLKGGKVVAYAFTAAQDSEPVKELDAAAVCPALRAEPKRFPEAYLKACPEPTAEAPAAEPAAQATGATGATEAPADAGSAADAGEVTP
jgi:hypothetical protein